MGYSEEVLRRARERLVQAKLERERENEAHRAIAYEKYPRLAEIDHELRGTMIQLASIALRPDAAVGIDALRDRNLALQREREWILEASELGEGYLDELPVCTKCGGGGFRGTQMCSCLRELCRQEQKKELTSLLGTGHETFEHFRLDVYPDVRDARLGTSPRNLMRSNLEASKRYAREFSEDGKSMLFSGATGLGKTMLSACIARQVADKGFSVVYETAISLFTDFENERFGDDSDENRGLTRKYLACDLLIIDDLGTEMTTQFTVSALYHIINTRMMEKRSTIISTNLLPESLERRYNPQIASRILGTYEIIKFVGNDLRRL